MSVTLSAGVRCCTWQRGFSHVGSGFLSMCTAKEAGTWRVNCCWEQKQLDCKPYDLETFSISCSFLHSTLYLCRKILASVNVVPYQAGQISRWFTSSRGQAFFSLHQVDKLGLCLEYDQMSWKHFFLCSSEAFEVPAFQILAFASVDITSKAWELNLSKAFQSIFTNTFAPVAVYLVRCIFLGSCQLFAGSEELQRYVKSEKRLEFCIFFWSF